MPHNKNGSQAFARKLVTLGLVLMPAAFPVHSQEPASPPEAPLDEVVVTGEFPGPGMWKVTRPDDPSGHVLWIAGDPWPLPLRLKWKSKEIEATALSAQEILRDAIVTMDTDEKIGFFRGMTLVPSLLSARKNPEKGELRDVLPPDLYARWLVQKKRYLGRESGVERWRPLFAADKLRKAAFGELRMRERGAIWDEIGEAITKAKLKVTTPTIKFTFKRSEVRDKIKEFSRESLDDVRCFADTLALTEALANQDVENARAKAWAAGDLPAMTALPALPSPYLPCALALMKSQVASEVIPADLPERVAALWVENAGRSLEANAVTFAVVPFPKLTRKDGYLDALRARGFVVEAPQ